MLQCPRKQMESDTVHGPWDREGRIQLRNVKEGLVTVLIWGIWKSQALGRRPDFWLGSLAGWSGLPETANMGREASFQG